MSRTELDGAFVDGRSAWATVAVVLVVLACSSESSLPGSAGTGGVATGGAGGSGEPIGGQVAYCDSITEEADCVLDPGGATGCVWRELEHFPNEETCEGVLVERCIPKSPGGSSFCSAADCPAEPAPNAYYFRVIDDGSVLLWHHVDSSCNTLANPPGFDQCQVMQPSHPEACRCHCEL